MAVTALVALGSFAVQLALVAASAALTLKVARVRSPALRLAGWQLALVVGTVGPLVAAVLTGPAPSVLVRPFVDGTVIASAATAPPSATWNEWCGLVLVGIGIGAVIRLVRMALGWKRLRRWAALPPIAATSFADAAAELGVEARLVCAGEVCSPFTFGHRDAVVVVPAALLTAPARTLRAVFLHELVHVARRDWSLVLVEEAIRAMLWFHPVAWWITAEIRLAREEIVDRIVAERLGSRRDYLNTLLAADAAAGPGWHAVPALIRRHQLARRVRALASEVTMSRSHSALAVLVVGVALVGAARAGAGAFPVLTMPAVLTDTAALPDDDVEKPVPTKKVQAVYPPDAKAQGVEGDVALDVRIGADGLVKEATVVKSVPQLDQAAIDAVKQWEFRPGRKNGKAVEVIVTLTFAFRLK